MKKHLIIFSFFLLFQTYAFSQEGFKAGILAGFDVSDIGGMDTVGRNQNFNKAGFLAGGFVSLPLSEKNSLQMEITYIQKGFYQPQLKPDSAGNSPNNGYFYKLSIDYFEIPILFKHKMHFTIRQKSIDKFVTEGGVSFGRLVRHKEQDSNFSNLVGTKLEIPIRKDSYCFHLGLSYLISQKLSFNIRFSNSFNSITAKNNLPTGARNYLHFLSRGTTAVWAFTLRYSFN